MKATLVRVIQTCSECPSQWDLWDTEGRYYYARYRHGEGYVQQYAAPGLRDPIGRPIVISDRYGDGNGYLDEAELRKITARKFDWSKIPMPACVRG